VRELTFGFLAGIGLTHLRVYEHRPAPDGEQCGCAHVHAFTDEAYYVVSGRGAIDLHDLTQGFRRVELAPGDFVQFGPGTLHRSISTDKLEVLALMSNAGLAERGDARIYFGPMVDEVPDEYARLQALPRTHGLEGALLRRDASVRAYGPLMDRWATDRDAYFAELSRFVAMHARLAGARAAEFESVVDAGPAESLRQTRARLRRHEPAVGSNPPASAVRQADGESTLGMCGVLRQLEHPTPV
jgi:mannose-6-phosphate isomerase-like protein (cupin superfamily)